MTTQILVLVQLREPKKKKKSLILPFKSDNDLDDQHIDQALTYDYYNRLDWSKTQRG